MTPSAIMSLAAKTAVGQFVRAEQDDALPVAALGVEIPFTHVVDTFREAESRELVAVAQ